MYSCNTPAKKFFLEELLPTAQVVELFLHLHRLDRHVTEQQDFRVLEHECINAFNLAGFFYRSCQNTEDFPYELLGRIRSKVGDMTKKIGGKDLKKLLKSLATSTSLNVRGVDFPANTTARRLFANHAQLVRNLVKELLKQIAFTRENQATWLRTYGQPGVKPSSLRTFVRNSDWFNAMLACSPDAKLDVKAPVYPCAMSRGIHVKAEASLQERWDLYFGAFERTPLEPPAPTAAPDSLVPLPPGILLRACNNGTLMVTAQASPLQVMSLQEREFASRRAASHPAEKSFCAEDVKSINTDYVHLAEAVDTLRQWRDAKIEEYSNLLPALQSLLIAEKHEALLKKARKTFSREELKQLSALLSQETA